MDRTYEDYAAQITTLELRAQAERQEHRLAIRCHASTEVRARLHATLRATFAEINTLRDECEDRHGHSPNPLRCCGGHSES